MLSIGENPFEKGLFLSVSFADAEPLSENFYFFWAGGSYVCKRSYPLSFSVFIKKSTPCPKELKVCLNLQRQSLCRRVRGITFLQKSYPPINNINFYMDTALTVSAFYIKNTSAWYSRSVRYFYIILWNAYLRELSRPLEFIILIRNSGND